jgi:hypothetical protein
MSLQSLNKAADECFRQAMPRARTREEHEPGIEVWNQLLDDAIANARAAWDRYVEERHYEHAAIARDMAEYFRAMKATKDAPFQPVQ